MKKIIEQVTNTSENNLVRIGKGTIISIIITLILLFIFSTVLAYSNVSESIIPVVLIIITGVSILIGSSISTLKIKKNGIVNGGIIGLIYILLLYIVSSGINNDFSLNMYSIVMIMASILAGMIGGIVGVNTNVK